MNIFVYSDESGAFDAAHNEIFVFGGLIFLGADHRDKAARKFQAVEKALRIHGNHAQGEELKACRITPKEKGKLFRSMNDAFKFGVIIRQKEVLSQVFENKKSKQRYLDYAYKIALKRAFQMLIKEKVIQADDIESIYVSVDEHTTATNGKYELRESLEQEFKNGTFSHNYRNFFPPIFNKLAGVDVKFCDSKSKILVRAADIIANKIYYCAVNHDESIYEKSKMYLIQLP